MAEDGEETCIGRTWNTLFLVAIGGLLGVLLTTIRYALHDHSNQTAQEAVWHFVPGLLAFMVGGAISLGGVAVVRNRLKRRG